jgi:membrane protease YdiL (CAAX protease family)
MDNEDTPERPLEVEPINEPLEDGEQAGLGTQEQMMKDPKWNGIPPVGNRPIDNKWKFLRLILLVFVVKIIIWSIYRFTTGNWDVLSDSVNNYTAGIFMKPLLQLVPVFILWLYVFKEKGLPFRLTRKHLFSSIIFGCILGLIYYFVASGVLIGMMEATGQGTDFHFVAGWDDAGWWLIIAMMFSYMIATGPTEELFARGFLQDQTARAFSLKFAIMFSAILFAAGHLPISILVYRLSFMTIVWYMIILVVMGCFFSLLYQWSRNIVFPAIIHGLWDWYLSLYALRGAYSAGFLADYNVNFGIMDFISTIITLGIMLPIFYIVYLVWWRHDKPLEEGPLAIIVKAIERLKTTHRIREYDRGWWPRRNPILVTAVIVGIFCLASIPLAGVVGTDDPEKFVDRMIGDTEKEVIIWQNNTTFETGLLNEGESQEFYLEFSEMNIHFINITLEWTDEPPINRFFQNRADTFRLDFFDSDENNLFTLESDLGIIKSDWPGETDVSYSGEFRIVVTLVSAGEQEPTFGVGLVSQEDNSNEYKIIIKYESFIIRQESGDSADVRWGT